MAKNNHYLRGRNSCLFLDSLVDISLRVESQGRIELVVHQLRAVVQGSLEVQKHGSRCSPRVPFAVDSDRRVGRRGILVYIERLEIKQKHF